MSDYLSVVQVADLLGVSPDTVRADIRAGRLPALEIGPRRIKRVRRDLIEQALAVAPQPPCAPRRAAGLIKGARARVA